SRMVFARRWARRRLAVEHGRRRRGGGDHGWPAAGQGKSRGPRIRRDRPARAARLALGQSRLTAVRGGMAMPKLTLGAHRPRTATPAALPSRRDLFWAAGALSIGAVFADVSRAATAGDANGTNAQPASWMDPALPAVMHRMVETNGIRLHIAEQGDG